VDQSLVKILPRLTAYTNASGAVSEFCSLLHVSSKLWYESYSTWTLFKARVGFLYDAAPAIRIAIILTDLDPRLKSSRLFGV
jgi:hypothetical protein